MSTTITRDEAARRFEELPLPSTSDEHWRFTDLRGFDPSPAAGNGSVGAPRAALDLDVAGRVLVTETGIEIVSAPDGIRFEPLPADYPSELVPDDDKFALENLARWQRGLLVHVPKGVQFNGDVLDTGVCHMAFFADPDGNQLVLHRRYAPQS